MMMMMNTMMVVMAMVMIYSRELGDHDDYDDEYDDGGDGDGKDYVEGLQSNWNWIVGWFRVKGTHLRMDRLKFGFFWPKTS